MSRWKRLASKRLLTTTLVLFATSVGGTVGCEIVAQVDRSDLDGDGGTPCVPENDWNDCTVDACSTDGTTTHTPQPEGTACTSNGGSKCDAAGVCVGCFDASECPGEDNACQTRTCTAGACGFDYQPQDTAIPTQTAGDCKIVVCDGNGATVDNNDDLDVPDDNNLCTDDVCTAGVPSNTNVSQGTDCTPAGGPDPLVCNDMGQCVGCNDAADCGMGDECKTPTCANNVCGWDYTTADTPVAAQTDNDCLVHVCDGSGNFVDIADDADLPLDDGNTCTDETCSAGAPMHPNMADGSACDEGDLCTTMDTCQAGACTAGTPVTCTASDQCHVAGTCDSATGTCSDPAAPDGTSCDDSDACTQTDSCTAGACTGANPITCTASDPCHVAGTCDSGTGICSDPAAPDGTSCTDNDACTQTDSCTAGTCTGANPITCTASDQCHIAGTCDSGTGTCSDPAAPDGTMCTSGPASGTCTVGACVACGDGIIDGAEACDDSNSTPGDGCNATCAVESGWSCTGAPSTCTTICGDGILRGTEACDDGNTTPGDGCSDTCTLDITCGPGEVSVILSNSTSAAIPDAAQGGIISLINVTQTGVVRKVIPSFNVAISNTGHIDSFLTSPHGVQRELATDVGSSANFTGTMFSDAAATLITAGTAPYTGTFKPEQTISDAAGFGNQTAAGTWALRVADDTSATTGTLNSWSIALCIDPSVTSVCGNGFVEPSEQCDDGNANTGDGCASCQLEITCAPTETLVVQTSSDGPLVIADNLPAGASSVINVSSTGIVAKAAIVVNAISHLYDGDLDLSLTSATGTTLDLSSDNGGGGDHYVSTLLHDAASTNVTAGVAPFRGQYKPEAALAGLIGQTTNGAWTFKAVDDAGTDGGLFRSWSLALCVAPLPVCGNGTIELGETCDDNNTANTDGCSSACAVEPGYTCTGTPSVCVINCGNGTANAGEQCDDMNTTPGDGCSNTCSVEANYHCTPAPSTCSLYESNCNDGIDNDSDGNTDATDSDCTLPAYFPGCQAGETLRVYKSFGAPLAIPDSNATGVTGSVYVADNIGNIASGAVLLNITHTWDSDLDVSLISPANATFDLTSDNGTDGDNYTDTVLHPVCPAPVTGAAAPFSGCYAPEASLLPLLGTPAQGTWTLKVADDAGGDTGTLDNWAVILCIAP